jgi:hypothetical protein
MSYKKLLPAFTLLIFSCLSTFAQFMKIERDTVSLNSIITKSVKYANDYPVEKVYVHFDKPYYSAGDTIWFKAYITADLHLPSQISKIVYADVYNNQDSLVSTLKLPVVNGVAFGSIPVLPESYRQGNYRFRAYTNYMVNYDAAYLFNKVLTIGNPVDNDVLTNITYSSAAAGNQPTVNARILYKDPSGKPYTDRKVSWRVEASHDEVSKGKGTTDANGYLTINLPPTPSITLSSATLFTVMDMGNRKEATRSFSLKSAAPVKDVQFFPEGGQLIAGIPTKIAVKALKADGLGIELKGNIVDNTGTPVVDISTQHLGMGVFVLIPEANKNYKANVTFADGTKGTYDLPRIQSTGITVAVANTDPENLTIKIMASEQFYQANQNKNFYLVAQTGGFIKYAAQTQLQKQVYSATIPKSKFPTGILQVTLFSSTGPVAERVVFIKRNDLLNVTVTSDKQLYNRRQPVKMNVIAKNGTLPAEANLSVSVIDESKVPVDEDAETTILTSLLLTSDLKGYIEKPNYYFKHADDKTLSDLDVLMLTQGYRRFSYRDILLNKKPEISILPEQGIDVTGTLRNRTGLPIFKGNVRLLIPDRNFSMQTTTNADGQFKFENLMVNDSTKVTINARDNTNPNNLMLMVDGYKSIGATRITNLPDEQMNIDSVIRPYLENSKRVYNSKHQLKEVVIKAAPPVKRLGHLDQAALTGLNPDPDHVIDGDRFKDCPFFVSCLQSLALGVTYIDNTFYVTRAYNQGNKTPMEVYVDGLQVDQNYLQSLQSVDIESVEVFFNDGLSGINRRDNTLGVLVINKKKAPKGTPIKLADLQKLIPPPYLLDFTPRGYSMTKEFYSPKYDVTKSTFNNGIDLRSTIYWNPRVVTDKTTGATTLQYFNADGTGSYRAVVEGIDKDGNIGRFVYRYKVQ